MQNIWKKNWEESKENYLKWWNGKGLVISMWEYVEKDGDPHEIVTKPLPAKDLDQFWFDPVWRSEYIHYKLSGSSFKADIIPVANAHLGPGSLAAILGAELEGTEDTIWIMDKKDFGDEINFEKTDRVSQKMTDNKFFQAVFPIFQGLHHPYSRQEDDHPSA